MECQCAGCYPEREARRKHREGMERIAELQLLRQKILARQPSEENTVALQECDALIDKARKSVTGR